MAKDNVKWCETDEETKGYKYVAIIWESNSSCGDLYVSNNLKDLKSYVYNQVKQLYDTASGNIYYSSDRYFDDPIYMVWNEGYKTYAQNQYRR